MIGLKIKRHRERLNYTQAHMAHLLDLNQSSYSRLESQSTDPRYSTLEAVAKALGLKGVEELICGEQTTFSLVNNKNASGITVHQNAPDYRDQYIATLTEQVSLLQRIIEEALNKKTNKSQSKKRKK